MPIEVRMKTLALKTKENVLPANWLQTKEKQHYESQLKDVILIKHCTKKNLKNHQTEPDRFKLDIIKRVGGTRGGREEGVGPYLSSTLTFHSGTAIVSRS